MTASFLLTSHLYQYYVVTW